MYKSFVEHTPSGAGSLKTRDVGNLLEVTMGVSDAMAINAYMMQNRHSDGSDECLLMGWMMDDVSCLRAVLGNPRALAELMKKCPKTLNAILAGIGKIFGGGALVPMQGHVFLASGFDLNTLKGETAGPALSNGVMRLYKVYDGIRSELLEGSFDECDETLRCFVSTLLKSLGFE